MIQDELKRILRLSHSFYFEYMRTVYITTTYPDWQSTVYTTMSVSVNRCSSYTLWCVKKYWEFLQHLDISRSITYVNVKDISTEKRLGMIARVSLGEHSWNSFSYYMWSKANIIFLLAVILWYKLSIFRHSISHLNQVDNSVMFLSPLLKPFFK